MDARASSKSGLISCICLHISDLQLGLTRESKWKILKLHKPSSDCANA